MTMLERAGVIITLIFESVNKIGVNDSFEKENMEFALWSLDKIFEILKYFDNI